MTSVADTLIKRLALIPHPEGGYYRETYRSGILFDAGVVSKSFSGQRCCSTAIYFLLQGIDFSAFHRIKADEIWHFYSGSPLTVHIIEPDGAFRELHLGSDGTGGQEFQAVVPGGRWFASSLRNGGYALVGCTTAPGFEFLDFEMADREDLIRSYPHLADVITQYTR
jgi:predicted cupin superfamily sugar epimerase